MRIVVFIIVSAVGFLTPLWFFILCAAAYAFWKDGYELIVLGVFIDAQFGVGVASFGYLYTLSLSALVLSATLLKPHLAFYDTESF